MKEIIDRQTLLFSVNLNGLNPSQIEAAVNLRFASDALILKSLVYNAVTGADDNKVVQIWCGIIEDGLMAAFPNNSAVNNYPDQHFKINNTFQNGNIKFQFQKTNTNPNIDNRIYSNPQPLISDPAVPTNTTTGTLAFLLEFVKYAK